MLMLHPVSGEEIEVNPANKEDEQTLLANGWKPAKAEAKSEKAPKAAKSE